MNGFAIAPRRQLIVPALAASAEATRAPGPSPCMARRPSAARSRRGCSAASTDRIGVSIFSTWSTTFSESTISGSSGRRIPYRTSSRNPASIISRASKSRLLARRAVRQHQVPRRNRRIVERLARARRTDPHVVPLHLRQQHAIVGRRPLVQVRFNPVRVVLQEARQLRRLVRRAPGPPRTPAPQSPPPASTASSPHSPPSAPAA